VIEVTKMSILLVQGIWKENLYLSCAQPMNTPNLNHIQLEIKQSYLLDDTLDASGY